MIPKNESLEMIRLLLDKTKQGQLSWSYNEEGDYSADFSRFSFLIGKNQANGPNTYFFSVVTQQNQLGRLDIHAGDTAFEVLEELYNEASRNTVLSLFEEAKHVLGRGQVIHVPQITITTTTTTAPPLPTPPTSEQVEKILSNVAGEWFLDYGRGQEQVIIDGSGNYYVKPNTPSKNKPPTFRLAIIACNPELTTVEWRKDKPNGESLQIEVLTITDRKMEGSAKHDQHRLVYTRTK